MTLASKPRTLAASGPLDFRRLRLAASSSADLGAFFAASSAAAVGPSLGGRWVGRPAPASHAQATLFASVDAYLLSPQDVAVLDTWSCGADVRIAQHGCVRYATDGQWLHGCAEIDDRKFGLEEAAHRAYADLFNVLAASDCPNLLRLWNYFADINREIDGVERYRQFNVGRQQAFIEARRSAFEGSPAACALGTKSGPLLVYFLAGRKPPIAIENPRQVSAYRYPDTYGPRSPTFSRAALVDVGGGRDALFISGTASIVGHKTMHVGDVRRQTEESLANVRAVLGVAAAGADPAFAAVQLDQLICTIYVRHASDYSTVRGVFEQAVGPDSAVARDAIYLHADICRADLLVEIEAHGFAQARSAN